VNKKNKTPKSSNEYLQREKMAPMKWITVLWEGKTSLDSPVLLESKSSVAFQTLGDLPCSPLLSS